MFKPQCTCVYCGFLFPELQKCGTTPSTVVLQSTEKDISTTITLGCKIRGTRLTVIRDILSLVFLVCSHFCLELCLTFSLSLLAPELALPVCPFLLSVSSYFYGFLSFTVCSTSKIPLRLKLKSSLTQTSFLKMGLSPYEVHPTRKTANIFRTV